MKENTSAEKNSDGIAKVAALIISNESVHVLWKNILKRRLEQMVMLPSIDLFGQWHTWKLWWEGTAKQKNRQNGPNFDVEKLGMAQLYGRLSWIRSWIQESGHGTVWKLWKRLCAKKVNIADFFIFRTAQK